MPVALGLPTGYPWVLATAAGSVFVTVWQTILVGQARRTAGIKYPQVYATKEEEASSNDARIFNCTQRAHQNTLEGVNAYVLSTIIAGFRYPRLTTSLGAVYLTGRVAYTLGYRTGDPSQRGPGAKASSLALLALIATSSYTLFQFLYETDFQI